MTSPSSTVRLFVGPAASRECSFGGHNRRAGLTVNTRRSKVRWRMLVWRPQSSRRRLSWRRCGESALGHIAESHNSSHRRVGSTTAGILQSIGYWGSDSPILGDPSRSAADPYHPPLSTSFDAPMFVELRFR